MLLRLYSGKLKSSSHKNYPHLSRTMKYFWFYPVWKSTIYYATFSWVHSLPFLVQGKKWQFVNDSKGNNQSIVAYVLVLWPISHSHAKMFRWGLCIYWVALQWVGLPEIREPQFFKWREVCMLFALEEDSISAPVLFTTQTSLNRWSRTNLNQCFCFKICRNIKIQEFPQQS